MNLFYRLLLCFSIIIIPTFTTAQTKVLIITGGHDFEEQAFYKMFDSFDKINYDTISQPRANEFLTADEVKEYECIVFYDMFQKISDKQKSAYIKLLEHGTGMLFLHHALVSYQDWPQFEKIIGGKYHLEEDSENGKSSYQHDVDFTINIMTGKDEHPVTRGIQVFTIHDEVYGNFTVSDLVHPLISTNHPKSTSIIGWYHQYKNARIIYLQPGHDHYAYENENYRMLVQQSISWLSSK